jgi:hypothetical protein
VCETSDGNLLLSGRHTCALYKLDRDTGRVIWRLGGRRSDFTIGAGASFAYQHHVRTHGASRITLFDNASYGGAPTEPTSRVLDLHVDERGRRVSLRRAFAPPGGGISRKMGSAELMPDGGMFVGWSDLPLLTEYAPDGTLRFSASFAASGYSYRALRGPWEGRPRTLPDVAVERAPGGDLVAYASWNGATDVATWRIDGGAHARALTALKQVPRAGFETAVPLQGAPTVVVAHALDATGARLASSRPTLVAA